MQALFNIINLPLGAVLKYIAGIFGGSFAGAVFVFTLLINLILIPLSIKSQKSSVQQTRIKPKLDDLKKRYGDDKQKYAEATQKLYAEEGVSMSNGCLPMILRLVLMMSIYYLIMSPLTYMTGADKQQISNVTTTVSEAMADIKKEDKNEYEEYKKKIGWREGAYNELSVVNIIRSDDTVLKEILTKKQYAKIEDDIKALTAKDKEVNIDYSLFSDKLNLTQTPEFSFNIFKDAQLIWLMPLLAFASQMLSSVLSMRMQKKINPEAPSMMGMMLTMPLISLFIGFSLPGGVAFYWACSSLIGGFVQIGVQNFYGPHKMLSRERSKELTKQCDFEANQIKKIGTTEETV